MKKIKTQSAQPFSTADAKAWLRITHADEDTVVADVVGAAAQAWEDATGYMLRSTTFQDRVTGNPDGYLFAAGPDVSLVTVTHNGTAYTVTTSSDVVRIAYDGGRPRLIVKNKSVWTSDGETLIDWTAKPTDAGTVGDVPVLVKIAVFSHMGTLYENRESVAPVMLHAVLHGWRGIAASHSWVGL